MARQQLFLGGVFWSKLWSSQIWSFSFGRGGVFWSKLWSSQIWSFSLGEGVFWSKLWSSQIWNFSLGGALWSEIPERGFLENLDKNLLFEVNCTETCLCITDSLSHTTYVETNDLHTWVSDSLTASPLSLHSAVQSKQTLLGSYRWN